VTRTVNFEKKMQKSPTFLFYKKFKTRFYCYHKKVFNIYGVLRLNNKAKKKPRYPDLFQVHIMISPIS